MQGRYVPNCLNNNEVARLLTLKQCLRSVHSGGVSVEADRVATFLKEVDGKSLDELLTAGRGKLASMPAAGAAPAAGGGGGGGGGAAAAPAAEEKKEEESEDEVCSFTPVGAKLSNFRSYE